MTYDSFTLAGASGDTVKKKWAIQQSDITSVVLEFTFTPSAAGEGFILQRCVMATDGSELEDLDPGDCA